MDMDQVAHAARALAAARSAWGAALGADERGSETAEAPPLIQLAEVLETGMVTMYARHFTGERRLPGRWWPLGKRLPVHERLLERRNKVVAHADETDERELMNPNAELGMPGAVVMERRRSMSVEELHDLAHHCERMYARYSDAVLQLKWDIGIAASGEVLGPDAYDE